MKNIEQKLLDEILPFVQTPAQYIGGEWNSRPKADADVRILLAFPDTYAIGMSHLGLEILYHLLNDLPGVAAERAYAPWTDMEELMRKEGIPLWGLETFTPAREFDIVGFSIQYEMSATNVLNMLDLAGIPVLASERTEEDPLVIAGGVCAFSPEPMSDFVDLFIVGDGEDAVVKLVEAFRSTWRGGGSRMERLAELARTVPGAYAPALYDVSYLPDGRVKEIRPKADGIPDIVEAARVDDLDGAPFPTAPIVPFVEIVHDRINIEIMRGCTHGCRFCQAGMLKRPVRLRSIEKISDIAHKSYGATGHHEISLSSLSTSDYPKLDELVERLTSEFRRLRVNLSVPSLRVGRKLSFLPSLLSEVRKPGLTIAPEAARQCLRNIINKDISDEEFYDGLRAAYEQGWRLVKLYFMIGLPGETDEDIDAICDSAQRVSDIRKEMGKGPAQVNVAVAPFVPKAHTPFQWEPMAAKERLYEIKGRLLQRVRSRRIKLKVHNIERSFLEGVFSRGDRRLGRVILDAWRSGCRFDSWDEHFHPERWQEAFRAAGLDPEFYANRRRGDDEVLPWSVISSGVGIDFLRAERDKAQRAETTPDCFNARCNRCGNFPCRAQGEAVTRT